MEDLPGDGSKSLIGAVLSQIAAPTSRRTRFRVSLLALAVIPLCLALSWTTIEWTPWYQAHLRTAFLLKIEAATGLVARAAKVERSSRKTWTATDLSLVDPETDSEVASVAQLLVEQSPTSGEWNASATGVEIDAGSWLEWGPRVKLACMQRPYRKDVGVVSVRADRITVHGTGIPRTWQRAEFRWQRRTQSAVISGNITPLGADSHQEITWRIERRSEPDSIWELKLDSRAIPFRLADAAPFVPEFDSAEAELYFSGKAGLRWRGSSYELEARGTLGGVDLNRVITDSFPHKLSGIAELEFTKLHVVDGRILRAAGRVESAGGVASRSLIESGRQWLGWRLELSGEELPPLIPYNQLALTFDYDSGKLRLAGGCDQGTRGFLLVADRVTVAIPQTARSMPVDRVARMLLPNAAIVFPTSRQAANLIPWMPLGQPAAETNRGVPPYVPVRLR